MRASTESHVLRPLVGRVWAAIERCIVEPFPRGDLISTVMSWENRRRPVGPNRLASLEGPH